MLATTAFLGAWMGFQKFFDNKMKNYNNVEQGCDRDHTLECTQIDFLGGEGRGSFFPLKTKNIRYTFSQK